MTYIVREGEGGSRMHLIGAVLVLMILPANGVDHTTVRDAAHVVPWVWHGCEAAPTARLVI